MKFKLLLSCLALGFSGCAATPQLYPNEKFKTVGKDAAQKDIELCKEQADAALDGKGKQVAKGAGEGALFGGALGAVAGAFSGDIGGGALFGGALGATAGGASAALSPSQVRRKFVDQCLHEKGYQVLGWE